MKRRTFLSAAGCSAATLACSSLRSLHREDAQWRHDGVGSLARFGVLTPDFDPVPESEIWAMAPSGISIHAARVRRISREPRAFADPPYVDEAAEQLNGLALKATLFAFTSSSYALGPRGDESVRTRLEQRTNGVPVILTCQAALAALRLLDIRRLSLIHPPWFSEATNEQGAVYFRSVGFDVVQCVRLEPARTFTEVSAAEVFGYVSQGTPAAAQAVFIGGNGLRAVGAIEALEARLRVPVLSANQVLLWDALRKLGHAGAVSGYGSIFQR